MAGFLRRHALRFAASLLVFAMVAARAAAETIEINWVNEGNFIGSPTGGTLSGTFLSSEPFEFLPTSVPYGGGNGSVAAQMTLRTTDGDNLYVDTLVNFPQPWRIVNPGSGTFSFMGGTGIFAGATGGGTVDMTLTFPGPPPVSSGLVDALWTGSITLLPPVLRGDYNANGRVEQADLDLVLLNWGADAVDVVGTWASVVVDQEELDGVLLNWGDMTGGLASTSVPEPVPLVLFTIALVLVAPVWQRSHSCPVECGTGGLDRSQLESPRPVRSTQSLSPRRNLRRSSGPLGGTKRCDDLWRRSLLGRSCRAAHTAAQVISIARHPCLSPGT